MIYLKNNMLRSLYIMLIILVMTLLDDNAFGPLVDDFHQLQRLITMKI